MKEERLEKEKYESSIQKTDGFGNGNRKWTQGKITWKLFGTE